MTKKRPPKKPSWPAYDAVLRDHVYAIGVLCVNYNNLENQLLSLIQHYSDMPHELSIFIFEKTNTNFRVDLLKKAVALKKIDPEIQRCINEFIDGYSACTDNRGILVHARILAYTDDNALIASKGQRKKGVQQRFEFPLETIHRVADEIQMWNAYGNHLCAYINRQVWSQMPLPEGHFLVGPSTLPGTLSPPERLKPSSPRT